jgi:hypothetical protein
MNNGANSWKREDEESKRTWQLGVSWQSLEAVILVEI